jgi:alpha-D-ribose 1-methylphosphonate 5-triphosphate diphosphatase PhnM
MQLDLSAEALLSQLGYSKTENSLEQMEKIMNNTKQFDKFSKHLLSLNDHLAPIKGFVAMSSTQDILKIKGSKHLSSEISEKFTQTVEHWADKYKVEIEKVEKKPTYYIIGHK